MNTETNSANSRFISTTTVNRRPHSSSIPFQHDQDQSRRSNQDSSPTTDLSNCNPAVNNSAMRGSTVSQRPSSPYQHAQVNIGQLESEQPPLQPTTSAAAYLGAAKRSKGPVIAFTVLLIIVIFIIDRAASRGDSTERGARGGHYVAEAEQLLGGDSGKVGADNPLAKRERALEAERIDKEKIAGQKVLSTKPKGEVKQQETKAAANVAPVAVGGGGGDKLADAIAARDPNLVYYPNSREMEMNLGAGFDSRTDARYVDASHLILVPGHAVFKGLDYREWATPENWAFERWQTKMSGVSEIMIQTYAQHIKRALRVMLRGFEESKAEVEESAKQRIQKHAETGLAARKAKSKSLALESVDLDPKPRHHENRKDAVAPDNKVIDEVEPPVLKADAKLNKKQDEADEKVAEPIVDNKKLGNRKFAAQEAIPNQEELTEAQKLAARKRIKESIVMFSGGQSRSDGGPRSEGLSYYMLALAMNNWNLFDGLDLPSAAALVEKGGASSGRKPLQAADVLAVAGSPKLEDESPYLSANPRSARVLAEQHIFAEEFARDSYENLLFSVARFYEITGKYPKKITVVGFEYKRQRFETIHRHAIRFPASDFNYIGIDYLEAAASVGISIPPLLDQPEFDALMAATAPPAVIQSKAVEAEIAKGGVNGPSKQADVVDRDAAALAIVKQQQAGEVMDVAAVAAELDAKKAQAIAARYLLTANDAKTIAYVREDMYLCKANLNTRRNRNPQHRVESYQRSAPHLIPLLRHCGPELFAGQLPWAYGPSD